MAGLFESPEAILAATEAYHEEARVSAAANREYAAVVVGPVVTAADGKVLPSAWPTAEA